MLLLSHTYSGSFSGQESVCDPTLSQPTEQAHRPFYELVGLWATPTAPTPTITKVTDRK